VNGTYTTIAGDVVTTTEVIDKSKFIAYAKGVASVEEAVEFIGSIKKQHFDATHNCSAYIFDDKAKYSDDGEPQGTAGMPIYECIKNKHLNRVCVVVTRYFGGIKLGAGGLVRAYSGGAAKVLAAAEVIEYRQCTKFSVTVDYSELKVVQRTLADKCIVLDTVFDTKVDIVCQILSENYSTITDIVIENTNGKAVVTKIKDLICPYQEEK
jgi:uncharacterized YigZ family protein